VFLRLSPLAPAFLFRPIADNNEPLPKRPSHHAIRDHEPASELLLLKTEALAAMYLAMDRYVGIEAAEKTNNLAAVYLALDQLATIYATGVADSASHKKAVPSCTRPMARTAADGTVTVTTPVRAASSCAPPVVRLLAKRFNEAENEAAQRLVLKKGKALPLTAEDKIDFLRGVRDGGVTASAIYHRCSCACSYARTP
jgi:hypothetical protein